MRVINIRSMRFTPRFRSTSVRGGLLLREDEVGLAGIRASGIAVLRSIADYSGRDLQPVGRESGRLPNSMQIPKFSAIRVAPFARARQLNQK